jgi:hypothetical protein
MEKHFIEYMGNQYATRNVDISAWFVGYGIATFADCDLSNAFPEDALTECSDQEVNDIDADIYFYCNSGFIESNPTDAEIVLELLKNEWCVISKITDTDWFHLMQFATNEIYTWYVEGRTNVNCESYECGGTYNVYAYADGVNRVLYSGKSPAMAAMTAISFGSALNISHKLYL